jgi:hypothetical protein
MNAALEFVSAHFPADPDEEELINPGRWGRRLAAFLAEGLRTRGLCADVPRPTDWGWRIDVAAGAPFRLWIGCCNLDESGEGYLVFVEPSRPHVRRLFRKLATAPYVEPIAEALRAALAESGKVSELRWAEI